MKDIDLFQMALGLTPPWKVSSPDFDVSKKRLDIQLDFTRGSNLYPAGIEVVGYLWTLS